MIFALLIFAEGNVEGLGTGTTGVVAGQGVTRSDLGEDWLADLNHGFTPINLARLMPQSPVSREERDGGEGKGCSASSSAEPPADEASAGTRGGAYAPNTLPRKYVSAFFMHRT